MKVPKAGSSLAGWNPGPGGSDDKKAKLMSTEAKDTVDLNATNELKEFRGKSGTPKGPFGQKGKEF